MAMEREKGDEVSPTLPYDVMVNILSRLPIKSILRFRCVSKSWLNIYTDPHFANLHLAQSPKFNFVLTCPANCDSIMTHLFVGSCDDREPTSHMISIPILHYKGCHWMECLRIGGSCRGLVLCSTHSGMLYLVNPSTGEMVRLPDSPFNEIAASADDYRSCGLGYDPSADDYKIVQLSSSSSGEIIITSLYSLKSNLWRRIRDFPFSIGEYARSGVFVNGNLHWFNSDMTKMTCFSLADETFGDVPLPDNISGGGRPSFDYLIGVVKGCLCIHSDGDSPPFTFWVMKEYGRRDSWTKFEFELSNCCMVESLDFSHNDEELFTIGNAVVMYNPNEKTYRNLEVHNAPTLWGEAIICLESLVSPKFYIRKKRS